MKRLGRLARWWWRLLLGCAILAGLAMLALVILPLTGLLPRPTVVATIPAAGARDVPPRSSLGLAFSTPMDRSSVEAAFQVEPPTPGRWRWNDRQHATWTPAAGWTPATTYTLRLTVDAQSMLRQRLAAPWASGPPGSSQSRSGQGAPSRAAR